MWKVRIEAEGYNRMNFEFENLENASYFLEIAQAHHDGILKIDIEKTVESEDK